MQAPGTPYWWETGAPLADLAHLAREECDILIIGAGFTGLTAALTASKSGARVTVVDAGVPGRGASSRNGGMCGPHARVTFGAMEKSFGRDIASRILGEMPKAYEYTRALIKQEKFACGFRQTGRIQLAATKRHFEEFKQLARVLEREAGYQADIIKQQDLGAHIRSNHYVGGLFYPDHGGLNPCQLHDGLMAACIRDGVQIVQNCAVSAVRQSGEGFVVRAGKGSVRAGAVILATNGYTRAPFRWHQRRVFALPSFIIATERLDPELLTHLAPGRRMMVETYAKHSYFRISPDGTRILFGGRAGLIPYGPEFAAKRLKRTMVDIWPELDGVELSHSWRGYTGFTHEHTPHVGCHDGIHFAMGYSGSGVAMAPYLGMKVAYRALGDKRGDTVFADTKMTTRAYHPGGPPLFLAAGELWYRQVVDRIEARQARRDRMD